jgi:S1-C subfamily serine protease
VTGRERGLEVTSVVSASPAARAGIRPEDVVLDVDGIELHSVGELQRLMSGERIGRATRVSVYRDGAVHTFEITPDELSN